MYGERQEQTLLLSLEVKHGQNRHKHLPCLESPHANHLKLELCVRVTPSKKEKEVNLYS